MEKALPDVETYIQISLDGAKAKDHSSGNEKVLSHVQMLLVDIFHAELD